MKAGVKLCRERKLQTCPLAVILLVSDPLPHKDHLQKDFSQENGRTVLMLRSRGHKLVPCIGCLQAAVSLPEWLTGWT